MLFGVYDDIMFFVFLVLSNMMVESLRQNLGVNVWGSLDLQRFSFAEVFHLAAEAQKALPLKEFPNLCRGDQELKLVTENFQSFSTKNIQKRCHNRFIIEN